MNINLMVFLKEIILYRNNKICFEDFCENGHDDLNIYQ